MAVVLITMVVIIAMFFIGWVVSVFNKFQYLNKKASRMLSSVNIVVKQRYDNILALSSIVERYSEHEFDSIRDTIKERGSNLGQVEETPIKEGLVNIKAVMEKYPELKANILFANIMAKDSEIEREIKEKRDAYNDVAQRYNTLRSQFPYNLMAEHFNFYPLNYVPLIEDAYLPNKVMGK